MDGLELLVKNMLAGAKVCDICGCDLFNNTTFYRECFNCNSVLWKNFNEEDGHGQRRAEAQGDEEVY